MLEKLIPSVCLRKNCKERCPIAPKEQFSIKLQILSKAVILIMAGILIGGGVSLRLHGQPFANSRVITTDPSVIVVATRLSILESNTKDISTKLDHLQSEADITEAMGAGIGIAITFLQLLGFFTKKGQI